MALQHLTFASDDPLFPGIAARHGAVRALPREGLVLFSVVSRQVDLVAYTDAPGKLARALLFVLRKHAESPVPSARVRPVGGRNHLQSILHASLQLPAQHGHTGHPALWTGSCLPDLIGARVLPGPPLALREALPRLRQRELLDLLGLPARPLRPLDDDELRHCSTWALRDATVAATAGPPDLLGKQPQVVAARRVVVALARRSGFTPSHVAEVLRVTPTAVRRLRAQGAEPAIERAVRIRLALEARVREVVS